MMLIFVDQISERLNYTLDFVFHERGMEYKLTNDHLFFEHYEGAKFNYSERHFDGVIQLIPSTLLFDEDLIVYEIHSTIFEKEDCLSFNQTIDPLASIFYVLSRMEEYTSTLEDEHGRFEAKNSLLFRYKWLEKAVCDRWAEAFLKFLTSHKLIAFKKIPKAIAICPTFDIDNAFAYQWKEGMRRWLSIGKDFLKGNRLRINERKQVTKGARIDPYDTYDYILEIAERGFIVNMFWLLGDYAKYDKNLSFKDVRHQRLIRKMAWKTIVGIHPSYKSNSYEYYLLNEKERLEVILNREVIHSRQHFLKFSVSTTYHILESMGIKHEYSMGYADHIGFRSGTARKHKWFDLNRNRVSDMTIHPFAYMDGTLNEYMELTIDEAKERIDGLYKEVKKYGGDFVFIWHNETIGNYGKWNGWRAVLEHTLALNSNDE
jgi:hypothetical protein